MGKLGAERSAYTRADNDWYVDPDWCAEALFEQTDLIPPGNIIDPSCGGGSIIKAAQRAECWAEGYDIVDRRSDADVDLPLLIIDFFDVVRNRYHDYEGYSFVSNPPYGDGDLCQRWVEHALSLEPEAVAVLVQARFLFSKKRAAWFRDVVGPPSVCFLAPRPSMPPGEMLKAGTIKASGGTMDYVWLVWNGQPPTTHWLVKGGDNG